MRVTTLRFGEDLWGLLEAEARLAGTSASQYIREAALARAAAAAARRGEDPFDLLAAAGGTTGERREIEQAAASVSRAREERVSAAALRAESVQAKRHAARTRERIEGSG